jgi:hypothetical protein
MAVTNKKLVDPKRKTVGSQYLEAARNNTDEYVTAGDLSHELMKSFTEDLNETISSNPFDGEEFYITVYEKKDLQMKRAILRRLYVSKYRPYPEDDTVVFHVNPKNQRVKFCWCLPHSTEMDNILMTFVHYDKQFINDIQAWKAVDLKYFGFDKIGKTLVPSKENRDKPLNYSEIAVAI